MKTMRKILIAALILLFCACAGMAVYALEEAPAKQEPGTQDVHIPLLRCGEQVTVHYRPAGAENYLPCEETLIRQLETALWTESHRGDVTVDISKAGYTDGEELTEFLCEYLNCADTLPYGFQGDITLTTAADDIVQTVTLHLVSGRMKLFASGSAKSSFPAVPEQITSVEQGKQRALDQLQPGMTDLEKALILHDYIVLNCDYDYDNYLEGTLPSTAHEAYGVFVTHKAVCDGYATAYASLMRACGIDCYVVRSASMAHAWNMICIDGEWYHVDCTWDDPVGGSHAGGGYVTHTYFLRSDLEMTKCLWHRGWSARVSATKSGAYIGYCFRPTADLNLTSGFGTEICVRYFSYYDGWYYTLVTGSEYEGYYGGDVTYNSYALKTDLSGEHRTFYNLGDDYEFLFMHDGAFYAAGCWPSEDKPYSDISRFSTDFSQREEIFLTENHIVNFSARFGVLWMIEEDEDETEEIVRPENSCVYVEEQGMSVLYDPVTETGYLMYCNSNARSVTVPASLGGYPIHEIMKNCFLRAVNAQSISLSQGIRKIDSSAFWGCTAERIEIPASCSSIAADAFKSCDYLMEISVHPDNPAYSAVEGQLCDKSGTMLLVVASPDETIVYKIPSGIRSIHEEAECPFFTKALFVPSCVEHLSDAFFPYDLKRICFEGSASQWNTIFEQHDPSSMNEVEISFNTTNTIFEEGVSYASYGILMHWTVDMEGEMRISPTDQTVPSGEDYYSIRNIVRSIVVEEGIKELDISSLQVCHNTGSISIPASCTSIQTGAKHQMPLLQNISVAAGNTAYHDVNGVLFSADNSALYWFPAARTGSYTVPSGVREIADYAFEDSRLDSISLPVDLQTIKNGAFYQASEIETICIPASAKLAGYGYNWFEGCSSLRSIEVEKGNRSLESIDGVLYDGNYYKSLLAYPAGKTDVSFSIPEGVRSISSGSAFLNDGHIRRLTIPATLVSGVPVQSNSIAWYEVAEQNPTYRAQDGVLYSKDMTTLIRYPVGNPRSTYVIPDGVQEVSEKAFCYFDWNNYELKNYLEQGVGALKTLTVPASVQTFPVNGFIWTSIQKLRLCTDSAVSLFTENGMQHIVYCGISVECGVRQPRELRSSGLRCVFSEDGKEITAWINAEKENGFAAFYTAAGKLKALICLTDCDERIFRAPENCSLKLFVTDKQYHPLAQATA